MKQNIFFDADLDAVPRSGTAERPEATTDADRDPATASHYHLRKQQLPEELSQRNEELERLRNRQEELEKQKQRLQALRRRMDAFDEGRQDLLNKLGRSLVLLQREEDQAARMTTLCAETRQLFATLKTDLDGLTASRWKPETLEEELTQALARIESARMAYRKSLDRINASAWHRGDDSGEALPEPGERLPLPPGTVGTSMTFWLKAGAAFSLPVALLLALALALLGWRMGWWV